MDRRPAEVWNEFAESWSPGFEVVDETDHGFRLRRRSDGMVLPREFPKTDIRPGH